MTAVFSLRDLEGKLQKVLTVISSEIENEREGLKGLYVHRSTDGIACSWGTRPEAYYFEDVETLAEADQVQFLCPACFAKNGGSVGTHGVFVSFQGHNIPDEAGLRNSEGKPSRWSASGTNLDDLVLTPSIAIGVSNPDIKACRWHGFVGSSGIPPGHAG